MNVPNIPMWASALLWCLIIVAAWRYTATLKIVVKSTPAMIFSAATILIIGASALSGPMMNNDLKLIADMGSYWGALVYLWGASMLGPYLIMAMASIFSACICAFFDVLMSARKEMSQ